MKLVPAPFSSSLGREAKTLQENTTKVLVLGCVPQERMRELQKQKIPADASSLAELRKHKIPPNSFRIPSKILKIVILPKYLAKLAKNPAKLAQMPLKSLIFVILTI